MRFTPPVPQILSQSRVEMEMVPVSEDVMEAQPDVEMETESLRSGTKGAYSTWEDCADKINMEACLDTAGECRRCDTDEVLVTVAGVRSEPTELQECEVFKWRRRYKKVIHADSHQHENAPRSQEKQSTAKNCDTRDAMRVSEHYVSTPCTRQPESFDTLSAFRHDWLESGVWTNPPTDLRLNDGWCWLPVRAFLLLSLGVSVWWSSGSVNMMTDAKHVEKMPGLPRRRVRRRSCRKLQNPLCPAEVWESFRVSIRASPQTARATRRKAARTSQCQCTRSTCRWGARAKPRRRSTWTRKQSQPR